MRTYDQLVIDANRGGVEALLSLLSRLSDESQSVKIIEEFAGSGVCVDKSEVKRNRMNFGMFSLHDIMYMLLGEKTKNNLDFSVNGLIVRFVVERLMKFGLITFGDIPGILEYKISQNSLKYFHDIGLTHNIVLGVPAMIDRISSAIPAINVANSNRDIECGSGLILKNSPTDNEAWLITNRHVVEGKDIIEIKVVNHVFNLISGPFLHDSVDLAALRVAVDDRVPIVPLDDDPLVLTPVVAIGYPRIPTASGQFLMAHRGEVNGRIESIGGEEFLAISCHVSPGNSGGPIVTEAGFCAGIVTQSGIGEFGDSSDPTGSHRTTYHMAIPASEVSRFLAALNKH